MRVTSANSWMRKIRLPDLWAEPNGRIDHDHPRVDAILVGCPGYSATMGAYTASV
jgi:hypothetical protein